jgi:hypothetical protein
MGKFYPGPVFPGEKTMRGESLCYNTGTYVPQWDSNPRRKDHQIITPDALTTVPRRRLLSKTTPLYLSLVYLPPKVIQTGSENLCDFSLWISTNLHKSYMAPQLTKSHAPNHVPRELTVPVKGLTRVAYLCYIHLYVSAHPEDRPI